MSEHALANIVRVDLITDETIPIIHKLAEVATECSIEPYLSEGSETILRVKNTIIATNKLDDLILGYEISLQNCVMMPEILALVDGGLWDDLTKKYSAPLTGRSITRESFSLTVYTEEKDVAGETTQYVAFTFPACKGTLVQYSMRDGEFFTSEMTIKSRPAVGTSPCTFEILETLPA